VVLGLAFHPTTLVRRFSVNFTDTNGNTVVARFAVVWKPAGRRCIIAFRSALGGASAFIA
jgi:hypothetical protein